MNKVRHYLYEIISISFGLALLFFFGILSFFPMEIMLLGYGQTWYYAFVFICFGIFIGFMVVSFYKERALIIIRILDLFITIYIVFIIILYLDFTADLMEPWIMGSWFLRYHGIAIGILLGAIIIKTIAGLSIISSGFYEIDPSEKGHKDSEVITFLIMASTFGLFILEILLYRYLLLFGSLISIFLIQIILLISSVILISRDSLKFEFINVDEEIPKENTPRLGIIKKINSRLKKTGNDCTSFWWLFIPLLLITVLGIIILIIYPYNFMIFVLLPFNDGFISAEIYLTQFLSILLLAITLFSVVFTGYGSKARKRFENYYKNKKHSHLKISLIGALDALKILGIFLVVSQILYFYEYPIFLPGVISMYLLFGIIGAVIYFLIAKTDKIRLILYTCAVITLIINFILTYIDGIAYAENIYDPSYEISFPFMFLHSWLNFILVGIPIGIILSNLFINLIFKHTDGTDSVGRSIVPPFTIFLGGVLLMAGNWILNNPGGDPPHDPKLPIMFTIFCVVLGITLFNGLVFHYIIEVIIPHFHDKKRTIEIKDVYKKISKKPNRIERIEKIEAPRKKIAAICLSAIVIISVFGGFMIYTQYKESYKRPILAYSPGNYYIWVQNSSERVSKNIWVDPETSPQTDAIKLSLAKNEYGAFQLVWRPLKPPIKSLTYEISDFEHTKSSDEIPSENCSLRYEEYIIEDEFPDLLKPIPKNGMDLDMAENYIFWFSIKTPYSIKTGKYTGEIKFKYNKDESVTIKIKLDIWDFAIPRERHLSTNVGGATEDEDRMENYFNHRINDYGLRFSYTEDYDEFLENDTSCYLNKDSNEWEFNWTYWDNMVQYKLDGGMNAFAMYYPLGIHEGRIPYISSENKMARLKNWLSQAEDHLEDKKWLNYSYLYFIDEFQLFIPKGYTREEYFDDLKELLKEMKDAAPKIKIMVTAPPTEELEHLYKYIDIWCPVTYDRDKERWDDRLDDGAEVWMYACVGPNAPYPNSHLYNRLYECRILLWQTFFYNLHGFLYWVSQGYYHGMNGFGYNGYGDGWFIYERDGDLYDTIRWENYLDAVEDYEYLWLLDAALDYLNDNSGIISESKIEDLEDEFDDLVASVVGEEWEYCDHPSTMYAARYRIGEILDDLSEDIDLKAIGEEIWTPPYKPGD